MAEPTPLDRSSDPSSPSAPFDRRALRAHRDRAALTFRDTDYLFQEGADRLCERLEGFARSFPRILDLGCHDGRLAARLQANPGCEGVIAADLSPKMARSAAASGVTALCADEEALPFPEASFDAVVSNLSLHWVNDLPGALVQIRRILKPDGLFLAVLFGGNTLAGLREAWLDAELALENGAGPHVSPFLDVRDGGDLLSRAGFALPVADREAITVSYPDPLRLMAELRAMGEANAVALRRKGLTRRETFAEVLRRYPRDPDGRISACFDLVWLTAWAPGPGQQKPLRPGSAAARLAEALDSREIPTGERPALRP